MTAQTTADRALLDRAFLDRYGWSTADRARIAGDASFRHYDRLKRDDGPAVLMDAPPPKEDVRPFVAIARWLLDHGFSAPRILGADVESGFLLLEDLGDDRFSRVIPREPALETTLYEAAIDTLLALHRHAAPARLPFGEGHYDLPPYDKALYLREAFLFTDWYMPVVLGRTLEREERATFASLWRDALAPLLGDAPVLVLRDYHADNLMWLPERESLARVGLLDFQDGVGGHPAYDLVSLLEDARRDVPEDLAEAMIARYLAGAGAAVDRSRFRRAYATLGAQRNMKIIGIFTRLYARDGKPHYLSLIPRVWGLLERDLEHPALAELRTWVEERLPLHRRSRSLKPANIPRLPKQAMVLSAGLGLRMRPLTDSLPKPLVRVGGQPMLGRILDQLAEAGIDHAVVNIHHLPQRIRDFVAARTDRLPQVNISDESERLLDSGGGVKKALPLVGAEPFFVLNGDMVWRDLGSSALLRLAMSFDPERMDALLLVMPREEAYGYEGAGDFSLEPDGRLVRRGERTSAPLVFTGIQILAPGLFKSAPEGPFSLNRIYDAALAKGRLFGLLHDGLWFHVGTMEAVAGADARLAEL